MKPICIFALYLLISLNLKGQDKFPFELKLVEHLVKEQVDSIRLSHELLPLANDSLLYVASSFHSGWMADNKKLSHTQKDLETKTPQDRVVHFGGKYYLVGENIMSTQIAKPGKDKSGKIYDISTPEGLSRWIVSSWIHSPKHYDNIINSNYQVTGVSIGFDEEKKVLYACQKFAKIQYKYLFEENKSMFPYSNYTSPNYDYSFDNMDRTLQEHKHDWNLKHNNLKNCQDCYTSFPPFLTLKIIDDKFVLRIENAAYVQKVIQDRYDGFAVEIVYFEDYICENPAYYSNPSRRNNQCKLNGELLEPLFKPDLIKGYKKRKEKEDVKFLSYVFKADTVQFFKRLKTFETSRFDSEYFEIKLGKTPKNPKGIWGYNLVLIQNKQICQTLYFTNYCGEVFFDSLMINPELPHYNSEFHFKEEESELDFQIRFEKNKSDFTKEDINPFLTEVAKINYDIDSIRITAYSSVEGDSILNHRLQRRRAENLIQVLKNKQDQEVPTFIHIATNWEHFYNNIPNSEQTKHLINQPRDSIKAFLEKNKENEAIESILAQERKGKINLYYHVPIDSTNLEYYIYRSFQQLSDTINESKDSLNVLNALMSFDSLYQYVFHLVETDRFPASIFGQITLPSDVGRYLPLLAHVMNTSYVYKEQSLVNKYGTDLTQTYESLILNAEIAKNYPEVIYNYCWHKTNELIQKEKVEIEEIQNIFNVLEYLNQYYNSKKSNKDKIDHINLNLNYLLMSIFKTDPMMHSDEALKMLYQIQKFYEDNDMVTNERMLELARGHVYFSNISTANDLLNTMPNYELAKAYYLVLKFQHYDGENQDEYYNDLIASFKKIDSEIWCNLFLNHCAIPFQVFDHEELRDLFCEECLEKNTFVKDLN